ncbi:MAG: nitroreductase family protein [Cyanobacteria bacterium P01_D01_bin.56]
MLKKQLEKLRSKYRNLRSSIRLLSDYVYDLNRFLFHSALLNQYSSKVRHQGRLIANYHVIEKGLSLREPRIGFGTEVVDNLVSILKSYQQRYEFDEIAQVALNTLFSYYEFNLERGLDKQALLDELLAIKKKIPSQAACTSAGGTVSVTKESILSASKVDFERFVSARHSIRNFEQASVDIALIEEAIAIALKTPSVCNRQTWKVHVCETSGSRAKALGHQNGNRGFGSDADKVLILTSDLNLFTNSGERNQGFVDGGLFAMSLIYALHSLGLGTCCLNWSVRSGVDRALRKDIAIGDSEIVIMMMAVGHLPDKLQVAQSSRRQVRDILVCHS